MRMITHSYDTYDEAVRAVNALEAAGIPHDDISLVSGDKDRTVATTVAGDTTGTGTGATIGTVLGGGAGLLAGIGALAIPGVGPVVAAGWLIATLTGAGVGAAAGGLVGSLANSGVDEADATRYAEHVGRGGTLVTVRASDDDAANAEYILEHGEVGPMAGSTATAAAYDTGMTGTGLGAATGLGMAGTGMADAALMGAATTPAAPAMRTPEPVAQSTTTPTMTGADDMVQVVKENLVVGKREVESGGVKVTSRVVETPVTEEVRLHEERVMVDRRPVNRPLTGVAADAFRERTLQARATSEEAVVGKEARVVEEIGLRKEATDRTETVRDTVRETKVDVEQVPGTMTPGTMTGSSSVTGGMAGTGSVRDNAATRAVDRTLDTNISGENPKV